MLTATLAPRAMEIRPMAATKPSPVADYVATVDCIYLTLTVHAYGYIPRNRGSWDEPATEAGFESIKVFAGNQDITAALSRNEVEGLTDEAVDQYHHAHG